MKGPRSLVREKDVQHGVRKVLEAVGFKVYSLSQGRPTRQSAGLPDLYAMHPRHGAVWFETKAPGGKPSDAQVDFQKRCKAAHVAHILGDVQSLYVWCWTQGILAGGESLADRLERDNAPKEVA